MELSEKLARMAELSKQAASQTDSARLLNFAVTTTRQIFDCRSSALVLTCEDSEQLSIRMSCGLSDNFVRDFRRSVGTGVIAEVMWVGSRLLYDNLEFGSDEFSDLKLEHNPTSVICVRLEVDSRAIGYFVCESGDEAVFSEDDLRMLKMIAEILALALDREMFRSISRKLVMLDPVTQVYSYSYFHRRLAEEVERAHRLNKCVSVMLLKIDDLKDYRETHGWQETEEMLRKLSQQVSNNVRNIDVVGRYGVDEIILYMPETVRDKVLLAAERIRKLVHEGSRDFEPLGLTVSVGVACLPEDGDTVERLLGGVTSALLAARRSGRNRVEAACTTT